MFGLFSKNKNDVLKPENLPYHVAFIMDGNGRWAKKRGLARNFGHSEGAAVFKRIVTDCFELGINTVTVYAFSTENWKRPADEVEGIMKLLDRYVEEIEEYSKTTKARVIFLGGREPFTPERREKLDYVEKKTASENKHTLNVALNYGGRDEICRAFEKLSQKGFSKVTEGDISAELFTHLSPDPELIIRTGGEKRLSNFLMWQSAYSELYFTKTLWPDFKKRELVEILQSYAGVHRRFGGL